VGHWSYVISDTPERWPGQKAIPLTRGITGMGIIRKIAAKGLVACFRQDQNPLHKGFRLFLEILDWKSIPPRITGLNINQELKAIV